MKTRYKPLFYISIAINLALILFMMKPYITEHVNANTPAYLKNQTYLMKTSNYDVFKTKQANIVMLGDSITYGVDWHELLGRQDVVNRGIGGDYTEGMLHRLYYIFKLQPKVVFLMGGINDIMWNYAKPETIAKNQRGIVTALLNQNIEPVITSTLYVSQSRENYKSINTKVDKLNGFLIQLAEEKNIPYIDLNNKLANNNRLSSKYTVDGVHLLGNAYDIWEHEITMILENTESLTEDTQSNEKEDKDLTENQLGSNEAKRTTPTEKKRMLQF